MTQQDQHEFREMLQQVLGYLTPSWHHSKDSRKTVAKVLMILILMNKLSHKLPLKVFSQSTTPSIVIEVGEDGVLSLSELWNALSPTQRAILIFFELQVPHTAEELLDETPETISQFFAQAENSLIGLPVWEQIQNIANSPNLPTSLPSDTNELRVAFLDEEQLVLYVMDDSDESRAISFTSDLSLYANLANIGLNVYIYQSTSKDLEMLDTVTEDIVSEVFDIEPSFS